MVTLLPKGAQTKLLKFFCLKILVDTGSAPWAANISANFRKNSKRPYCYTQMLGGNWFRSRTKKTLTWTEARSVNYTLTAAEIGLSSLFHIFFGSDRELRRRGSGRRQGRELHAHIGRDCIVFFVLYFLWFRSRTKKTGIWTEAGGVNYTLTAAEIGLSSLFIFSLVQVEN